jgi:hypothetical protein
MKKVKNILLIASLLLVPITAVADSLNVSDLLKNGFKIVAFSENTKDSDGSIILVMQKGSEAYRCLVYEDGSNHCVSIY